MKWTISPDSQFFGYYAWSCATSDWFWGRRKATDPMAATDLCSSVRKMVLVPVYITIAYTVTLSIAIFVFVFIPMKMLDHGSLVSLGMVVLVLVVAIAAFFLAFGALFLLITGAVGAGNILKRARGKPSAFGAALAYADAAHRGVCPLIEFKREVTQ